MNFDKLCHPEFKTCHPERSEGSQEKNSEFVLVSNPNRYQIRGTAAAFTQILAPRKLEKVNTEKMTA
jgi:hypothetical protein